MSLLEIHSLEIPWLTGCSQNPRIPWHQVTPKWPAAPFRIQRSDKKIQASVRVHDEVGASVREPIWSYLPRFKISTSWVWMSKPLQIRLGFLNSIDIVDLFSIIGFIILPSKIPNSIPRSTELLWTWFLGVLMMGSPGKKGLNGWTHRETSCFWGCKKDAFPVSSNKGISLQDGFRA